MAYGTLKAILVLVLFLAVLGNIIDATASNRQFLNQFTLLRLATSPINAVIHIASPRWLQAQILKSPILKPTEQLFPSLKKIRDAFPTIYREAIGALAHSKQIKNDVFFNNIADDGWLRFYLKWYGPADSRALEVCPETSALIATIPEVHLAMFSILEPHSKIKRHEGPTRMSLRYHLGIQTPNDDNCFIEVGREKYSWRDQEDVMFDDTFSHTVENNTHQRRIILFLDIERPQIQSLGLFNKHIIKTLGPLTTRANDKQEVMQI